MAEPESSTEVESVEEDYKRKKPKKYPRQSEKSRINILHAYNDWERIKSTWIGVSCFDQQRPARPEPEIDQGLCVLYKRNKASSVMMHQKAAFAKNSHQTSIEPSQFYGINQHFCNHMLLVHEKFCNECYHDNGSCQDKFDPTIVKTECCSSNDQVHPSNTKTGLSGIFCSFCLVDFPDSYSLVAHVTKEHIAPPVILFSCILCDATFANKEYLKNHIENHPVIKEQEQEIIETKESFDEVITANYVASVNEEIIPNIIENEKVCGLCLKEFEDEDLVKAHLNQHAFKIKFSCHLCDDNFFNKKKLQNHYSSHKRKEVYKLLHHLKEPVVLSLNDYSSIIVSHTPTTTSKCIICEKITPERMDNHLKRCHPEVQYYLYQCHICNMFFGDQSQLKNHFSKYFKVFPLKRNNSKPNPRHKYMQFGHQKLTGCPFPCDTCSATFVSEEFLQKHKIKCGTARLPKVIKHPCEICTKSYNTRVALDCHTEFHHTSPESKIYRCHCGKLFSQMKFVRKHELRHKEKKHKCEVCDKGPFDHRILKQHMKTHAEPCKCGDCEECNDMKAIHACSVCKKMYKTQYLLKKHVKSHYEVIEKTHTCQVCDKKFAEIGTLKRHMKTHINICSCGTCDFCKTRDPRTQCTVCKRLFATTHHLKRHSVVHTGARDFVCEICGKGFNQAGNLKVHVNSHMKRMEKDK